MSQYARVNSIVMLKQLRSALATFAETASVALDEVTSEIQRTTVWLNEDRRRHWKNEVRLRTEQQVQAKLALKRKGIFDLALTGGRTSAIDEKKALAKAERRLQEARRRLARTQSWIQRIDKELSDYRAATAGLTGAIDTDIPNARARLEKMVESLEAYVALAPPEAVEPVGQDERDSVLQPEEAPASVFRAIEEGTAPEGIAKTLRGRGPAAGVRERIPVSSEASGWIAEIAPGDALHQLKVGEAGEPGAVRAEDKVVVAVAADRPDVIYLERTVGGEGDSGWTIGLGEAEAPGEYTAMRVSDLLGACPPLKDVLGWPVGYLLLIDLAHGCEAVFDADDHLVWQSPTGNDAGQAEGEAPNWNQRRQAQ